MRCERKTQAEHLVYFSPWICLFFIAPYKNKSDSSALLLLHAVRDSSKILQSWNVVNHLQTPSFKCHLSPVSLFWLFSCLVSTASLQWDHHKLEPLHTNREFVRFPPPPWYNILRFITSDVKARGTWMIPSNKVDNCNIMCKTLIHWNSFKLE